MPDPIYFDTCVFIELLQQANHKRFDSCEELRAKAERKELIIVTSAVTIAEVNKIEKGAALPEVQSRKILDFFENEYIAIRTADRRTAEYAHELTRTHGLTPLDAIHVATAILSRATVLYTYDGAKKRRKGLLTHHLEIGNPPLRIEQPPDPDKGTLFDPKFIAKNTGTDGDDGGSQISPSLSFGGSVAADAPNSDNEVA